MWVGAGITSLLFTLGKFLIGLYLGQAAVASSYGAAGSLIIILLWTFYSAQILFFGAEFTQVFAKRFGTHQRNPYPHCARRLRILLNPSLTNKTINSPMKSIRYTLPLAALAAFALAPPASCRRCRRGQFRQVIHSNAYEAGLAEINAAQLGQSKSANADIKAFSDHIAADHTKANAELKTLADSKKVTVSDSPSLVQQGKGKLLDMKSGDSFDKSFAEAMVSDHKQVIEAFEKEANEGKDADVKAFAAKTLPTLKMHLSMAEDLQNKVGK